MRCGGPRPCCLLLHPIKHSQSREPLTAYHAQEREIDQRRNTECAHDIISHNKRVLYPVHGTRTCEYLVTVAPDGVGRVRPGDLSRVLGVPGCFSGFRLLEGGLRGEWRQGVLRPGGSKRLTGVGAGRGGRRPRHEGVVAGSKRLLIGAEAVKSFDSLDSLRGRSVASRQSHELGHGS